MPQGFDTCSKTGRVRTISGPNKRFNLKSGEYLHVCFKNGVMHRGEIKHKEASKEKKSK